MPHSLANVPKRRSVVVCEGLFHGGDIAGQWPGGAAVAEGVVCFGQQPLKRDGL